MTSAADQFDINDLPRLNFDPADYIGEYITLPNGEKSWCQPKYPYEWQKPKELIDYQNWQVETVTQETGSKIFRNVITLLGTYFGAMVLISIMSGGFALL